MFVVTLIDFNHERAIHAIKGVKNLSGLGLRESKNIVDDLRLGRTRILVIPDGVTEHEIRDALVESELHWSEILMVTPGAVEARAQVVRDALGEMPADLTVRQIWQVLNAVEVFPNH